MSESHTHHHHHHHKMDGASKFKWNSLRAIQRKKTIAKWVFRILATIAIIMVMAVIMVYTIG